MRHRLHNPFSRLPGVLAWLLAVLLLWMGTGGVLHHTDEGPNFLSASARAAFGHVTPATPADDCAACQWTQGVQSGTFSVCRLDLPVNVTLPCSRRIANRIVNRSLRLRSPRAPPAHLS